MSLFIRPESMGWGNIALCLSDLCYSCKDPKVHESINDVERGVVFSGFTITDRKDLEEYKPRICVNPYFYSVIHRNLSTIIQPSDIMKKMIEANKHLVGDIGIHIRRGAHSSDSSNVGCHVNEDGSIRPAYFASDSALEKFLKVVHSTPGTVYLASDSREVKSLFKKTFPGRIRTLDTEVVLTYKCDVLKNYEVTEESRLNCYLEWFLLSMCSTVYITGGAPDGCSISTFGYSAAAYGKKPINVISN